MATGLVILLFWLSSRASAGIEDIDLRYTQPAATFDELYDDGIQLYSNESWSEAIRSFSLALADFRQEREVRANCILRCREKIDKSEILRNEKHDGGTLVLYYVIRVRRCADLCQEKFMGRRGPIAKYIRDVFEKREPYNYLQYSYFKLKQYQKAANAALTYLERHPDDKIMLKNLKLYVSSKFDADVNKTKSMESHQHMELFIRGDKEYEEGKYSDCIFTFEEALDEYNRAHKKCLALCEYQHEKHQASFSVALFQHYMAIVQCRLGCQEGLALVNGVKFEKFYENHFHYLQFCYYESGKVKDAAINAKTYLLFHPDDPIMVENFKFYLSVLKLDASSIEPRKIPEKLFKQRKLDRKLLAVAKYYANPDVIFDGKVEDIDSLANDENLILGDDDVKNEMSKKSSIVNDQVSEESKKEKNPKNLLKIVKKPKKWQRNPKFKEVQLFLEGKQLNGTRRFVIDNMASEEECNILSNLVETLLEKKRKTLDYGDIDCEEKRWWNDYLSYHPIWLNWNNQSKLANFGDGYKHNHDDPKHPFTKKESFEGVNIKDAVTAAVGGEITLEEAELYANLSDKMRHFVEDYFELKQPLYIAYTHLVCRTAYTDAAKGDHISHPVHSDNCILGLDGPGTCPKVSPAYTWRDFSGVLYLNEDFDGGEFIFADPDGNQQASVKPKCGRMVAFSGGIDNIHGVLGIKSGRRCALPLWFTLQGDKIEDNRGIYQQILNDLRTKKSFKEKQATSKKSTSEAMDDGSGGSLKSEL